jgi:hypothetical protein
MDPYDRFPRPVRRRAPARNAFGTAQFGDFDCCHCQRRVSADPLRSGVQNRNHCPYCLWSRHVDLRLAGDRLCACLGRMRPVGLTFKRSHKKYTPPQPGELMLVHQCTACGAFSLNRLAADDCPASLWEIFEGALSQPSLAGLAERDGIALLDAADGQIVRARLFGKRD